MRGNMPTMAQKHGPAQTPSGLSDGVAGQAGKLLPARPHAGFSVQGNEREGRTSLQQHEAGPRYRQRKRVRKPLKSDPEGAFPNPRGGGRRAPQAQGRDCGLTYSCRTAAPSSCAQMWPRRPYPTTEAPGFYGRTCTDRPNTGGGDDSQPGEAFDRNLPLQHSSGRHASSGPFVNPLIDQDRFDTDIFLGTNRVCEAWAPTRFCTGRLEPMAWFKGRDPCRKVLILVCRELGASILGRRGC